jgi:hypothetical protein
VTLSDTIQLHAGSSPGLRACQQAVSALAVTALLWSRTEPMWIMIALCAFGVAHGAMRRISRRSPEIVRLVLRADGNAIVHSANGAVPARLCAGGWVSRWCSLVSLEELLSGRRVQCLVCRSRNGPDDYRRLLVYLRMDAAQTLDRAGSWL